MNINYSEIVQSFDPALLISKEDDFVYFLNTNISGGNLLLQEKDNTIIIWSNEVKIISYKKMYELFLLHTDCTLIFPYIDSEEEYNAIVDLGGKSFEFAEMFPDEDKLCDDYSMQFGSLIISRDKKSVSI